MSATVESTSYSQPRETVSATVKIVLVGCDADPAVLTQLQSTPSASSQQTSIYPHPAASLQKRTAPGAPAPSAISIEAASQAPDLLMDIRPPPGQSV